ncbi:MAG: thioredoxin domain-containing protein [Patescibacteria group bacterium]
MNSKNNNAIYIFLLIIVVVIVGAVVLISKNGSSNAKNAENDSLQSVNETGPKLTITDKDQIYGEINSPITLVEYSDFQCPYCVKFHKTMKQVIDLYPGKVRWVYRHFPLDFHKTAQKAAEATEAAGEHSKFWEYSDKLAANSQADGTGLNEQDLIRYAEELSLDMDKFKKALKDGKFADKVKSDLESGEKVGVTGTPGTFIIDSKGKTEKLAGALSLEQMKAKINPLLEDVK